MAVLAEISVRGGHEGTLAPALRARLCDCVELVFLREHVERESEVNSR